MFQKPAYGHFFLDNLYKWNIIIVMNYVINIIKIVIKTNSPAVLNPFISPNKE